jgi:hypothetical protein
MRHTAILLTAIVVGCSSSSGNGSGGSSGGACSPVSPHACFDTCNPCTHTGITTAQVAGVVNAPVVEQDTSKNGGRNCAFQQNDSIGAPLVQVAFDSDIDDATFKGICNGTPVAGETITPVTGVGDAACSVTVTATSETELVFEKGCWAYQVSVQGPAAQFPQSTIEADEKTLALDILPSL